MGKIGHDVLPGHDVLSATKIKKRKIKRIDPWLDEYVEEEKEAAAHVMEKVSEQIARSSERSEPSLMSLVRALYEDKFQYKQLISFSSYNAVPPKLLLAFNEQVVLQVYPQKSREEFIRLHGLTPEEIAHLYRNKRMLPILRDLPTCMEENVRDYMNVLLQEKPPIYFRTGFFLEFISKGQIWEYQKLGEGVAKCVKGIISENRTLLNGWDKPLESIAEFFPTMYSDLCCIGFGHLANHMIIKFDLGPAAFLLYLYNMLLADPILNGLGATPQIHNKLETLTQDAFSIAGLQCDVPRDLVFPTEVGEFLTEYYDLSFPTDPSMEIVDKAYCEKELIRTRRLLYELDKVVREGKRDEAIEKGKDFADIFSEAIEVLPALDERIEKAKWSLHAVALGAIGLIGSVNPVAGLLAGLGYRVMEKKITDLATPKLAGIHFNPLSTAIWKFERQFTNFEKLRTARKKLRGQV